MVKAFLFDLDGTLISSTDLHYKSFKPVLIKHKLEAKPLMKKYFGMIAEDIIKKVYPELSDKTVNEIVNDKRDLFMKQLELINKQPCSDQLLSKLSSKGVLALASCSHNTEIKGILNQLSWTDHFKLIVSCYDVKKAKPAPDLLLEAIKRLGVKASDCIYIGDSIYDAMAAKSAGVKFVAVIHGAAAIDDFKRIGVKFIYPSLCAMLDKIEEWVA